MRLTPLREFTMMRLMNEITDKPDWDSKVSITLSSDTAVEVF